MPSNFPNVNNGDIIDESHVDRNTIPVNNLESGAAWYRDDTGTANVVKVNFATGNVVSNYTPGLIVHFKAAATNTGAATLTVTGPSGDLSAIPLVKKGGLALEASDITAGQVIAAVYAEDSPGVGGRFEVLGGLSSGGPIDAGDMPTGIDAANMGSGSVSNTEFGYLDGVTGAIQGQLDGKQNQADPLDEISALSLTKGDILVHDGAELNKLDIGSNGQVLSADSAEVTGLKWVEPSGGLSSPVGVADGGTGATTAAGARTNLDIPSNSELTTGLAEKANSSHTHAAADITSGQVGLARGGTGSDLSATGGAGQVLMQTSSGGAVTVGALAAGDMPSSIDAANIGGGSVTSTEFGYLDGVTGAIQAQLDGKASSTHTHAASDITSGQLGVARGGTGTDLSATGGSGQVLKQNSSGGAVTVGALAAGDMPTGIDAANIGSGDVSNTEFGYLDGVTSAVQTQLDGKASSTHAHAASDITSGQLDVARGGTGADLSATGGSGQVLKQNTSGGAVSVGALAAGDMPSGIDAAKIGGGGVSNTEFGYLDGVTSAVQTQLNAKASSSHTHPASAIGPGTINDTEFGYLNGVTSAIQTQLNAKASSSHTHPATAIGPGTISDTEFGYLNGVTSAIQTQLNGKVSGPGGVALNSLAIWDGVSNLEDSGATFTSSTLNTPRLRVTSMPNIAGGFGVYRLPSASGIGAQYELVWLASNVKHKKDVTNIQMTMDDLMAWRPVEFTWKEAFGGSRDLGFIANELDSVYPLATLRDAEFEYLDEATGEYQKDQDGNPITTGNIVPMGVKYDRAWIPMLAAIQDFYQNYQSKVADLEARLAALEGA